MDPTDAGDEWSVVAFITSKINLQCILSYRKLSLDFMSYIQLPPSLYGNSILKHVHMAKLLYASAFQKYLNRISRLNISTIGLFPFKSKKPFFGTHCSLQGAKHPVRPR